MNTFKKLGFVLLVLAIVTAACKKDNPSPNDANNNPITPMPQPAISLDVFFESNEINAIQQFTINAQTEQTITGSKGTSIIFYPNSFLLTDGTLAQGDIQIELIEIYEKTDMILLNKQTLGNHNGTLSPLISGGEFRVQAFQGQQQLNLAPNVGFILQAPAANGINPLMSAFVGNDTSDVFTWNPIDSSTVWGQENNYTAYFSDLGWLNLDYFMNSSEPQTTLQVQVQEGLDNTNCAVFISFDGLNAITTLWHFENGAFSTGNYYTIPVGQAVHFIALSFAGMIPHLAIVGNTIENNHLEVLPTLQASTPQDFQNAIDNLP